MIVEVYNAIIKGDDTYAKIQETTKYHLPSIKRAVKYLVKRDNVKKVNRRWTTT